MKKEKVLKPSHLEHKPITKYCTNCVMPDTRPRIRFNDEGVCNACQWAERKKMEIDWDGRWKKLMELKDKFKKKDKFDCIVPVSGGKDSSYVAYMMKHKVGMNPLTVHIHPPLCLEVGDKNMHNFFNSGYDNLTVVPNPHITRELNKQGFVEAGRPQIGWMTAVQASVFKIAVLFDIPLVMFGEEGESEYGGTSKLEDTPFYDAKDSVRLYLMGHDPRRYLDKFSEGELYWFLYPKEEDMKKTGLSVAHWSYFENWDPYEHYLVSKEKCGLEELEMRSQGTYNNFAQTDTALYSLHTWLMYLKFGFGRCSQDVGIDIRRGSMSRKQGLELVKKFDQESPEEFIPEYLDYFQMTREEFDAVIEKHVNKHLFKKINGEWVPTFEPW